MYCEYGPVQGQSPACKKCKREWDGVRRYCIPSYLGRVRNFLSAYAKHLADGLADVSEDVYQARLAVCSACPNLTPAGICAHPDCGCPVEKKAKWGSESCPLKKWELEVISTNHLAEKRCGCQ